MRALAINVAANTTLPGVRGPVRPDGSFAYVPIPEREPTDRPVPTYADLDLPGDVPIDGDLLDRRVHLDPEFPEYPCGERYSYGDEHGLKARPIAELSAGDALVFYATLTPTVADTPDWMAPDWGAYAVGVFRLARDPVTDPFESLSPADREPFANNAHVKRETVDAEVLVAGDDRSRLLERAYPLSAPSGGADPNRLVTDHSTDSGRGPWWRRPLAFDPPAAERLLDRLGDHPSTALEVAPATE
jgi:hypothetical protein